MHDPVAFGLFVAATLALTITPGPAVIYIVTHSLSQGRLAGVVSCLGIAVGGTVHVLAAALGLSAVLASSAVAFSLVKYAGAAYLLWLGWRKFAGDSETPGEATIEKRSLGRIFRSGVVVNILNPKTALFFLAFLPQFVDPSAGSVRTQFILLGTLFVLIALCTDMAWGLLAGAAGTLLTAHPAFPRSARFVSGSVYVGLGLATAFAGTGRK